MAITAAVSTLLEQIRRLTPEEQLELIKGVAGLVGAGLTGREQVSGEEASDPVLELLGAYASASPLIDDIPASADPDLYLAVEASGAAAVGMHAWELAPARYERCADGRAVRKDVVAFDHRFDQMVELRRVPDEETLWKRSSSQLT